MTTTAGTHSHSIDQGLFRSTVGHYASGITIITGHDDQGLIGFTCQSFYKATRPSIEAWPSSTARSGQNTTPATASSCSDALSDSVHPLATIQIPCCTSKVDTDPSTSDPPMCAHSGPRTLAVVPFPI